jgi:hypothetical protein
MTLHRHHLNEPKSTVDDQNRQLITCLARPPLAALPALPRGLLSYAPFVQRQVHHNVRLLPSAGKGKRRHQSGEVSAKFSRCLPIVGAAGVPKILMNRGYLSTRHAITRALGQLVDHLIGHQAHRGGELSLPPAHVCRSVTGAGPHLE